MLKLINVKRDNNIMEADYIPEDSKEVGYIKINLNENDIENAIIDSKDTSYDKFYQSYLIQAYYVLKAIADKRPYKEEYIHLWY